MRGCTTGSARWGGEAAHFLYRTSLDSDPIRPCHPDSPSRLKNFLPWLLPLALVCEVAAGTALSKCLRPRPLPGRPPSNSRSTLRFKGHSPHPHLGTSEGPSQLQSYPWHGRHPSGDCMGAQLLLCPVLCPCAPRSTGPEYILPKTTLVSRPRPASQEITCHTILTVRRCCGLSVSQKKIHSGPNPWYLGMSPYWTWGLCRWNQIKMRSYWMRVHP